MDYQRKLDPIPTSALGAREEAARPPVPPRPIECSGPYNGLCGLETAVLTPSRCRVMMASSPVNF